MDILDVMNFRFACKQFDSARKIPDEEFRTILEAGRLSPSSFGFEPWEFLVVDNREIRETIAALCWGAVKQAPSASRFMILLARKPTAYAPTSDYIVKTIMADTQNMPEDLKRARVEKFTAFLDEDFELSGNPRAGFEWACRQTYIAMESMILAAASLGIDSCPIEGFPKEKLEAFLADKGVLDRETFGVACMLAFGYRQEGPHRPKSRRPREQVVRWID